MAMKKLHDKTGLLRDLASQFIHQSLNRHEFYLEYQPVVSFKDNSIVSMEALVRWKHPLLGVMASNEFIPVIEDTKDFHQLCSWIIKAAGFQAKKWEKFKGGPYKVSINISRSQLLNPHFPGEISGMLEEAKLSPELIELEIKQDALLDNHPHITDALMKIAETGICLVADDFKPSPEYFKTFSINGIKSIKIKAEEITYSENFYELSSIIDTARAAGIIVTATHIETFEQFTACKKAGCDHGQGFYFSYPLTIQNLEEQIAHN